MRGSIKGGRGPDSNPLNNYKNIGFLISNCPDPLKNHKATKPACKFWPSSARQRNAISMAIIGPPTKRHLNIVSLVSRWWLLVTNKFLFSGFLYNVCTSLKNNVDTIFLNFIDEIDTRTDINLLSVRPQKIPGTQWSMCICSSSNVVLHLNWSWHLL